MKSEPQCQNIQKYYPYQTKSKSATYKSLSANVYEHKFKQRNSVNKTIYHDKYVSKPISTYPSSFSSKKTNLEPPVKSIGHYYVKSPLSTDISLDNVDNINELIIQKRKEKRATRNTNKWLYSFEELRSMKKPCRKYITFEEELIQRAKAIHFIKTVCLKLNLGHHVLSAASIFLHRYYVRKAIQDSRYQDIASACIFLACKLFESKDMRSMRQIVSTCAKVSMKNNDFEVDSKLFGTWERNIVHNEMEILQVICYDLELELPSTYIQEYTKALKTSEKLNKYIYCVINDCLTTTLCLRHRWNVIVAAALYVSAKLIGEQIYCDGNKNWWSQFSINENEMKNIIREILIIYQSEIESIPDRQSPMTTSSLNVMSPPLSNPHPSQISSLSTSQLKSELEQAMPYSGNEEGMIPINIGSNQIPPSPTLSETSEISVNKKLSKTMSYGSYKGRSTTKKGINLRSYLNSSRASAMKE
ncbi:cyclin-like protein [Neocallimastix sp. 'constans']|jgi:transcription initiation factor TFIIIB Brf1 subunit/transcription initiation factor TFIIB